MLMKRRRSPSSTSRSLMPGWSESSESIRELRLAPSALTAFSPPVYVRRMVGIRTSMAMSASAPHLVSARRETGYDGDLFLGHGTVDDSIRPELHRPLVIPVLTGADERVMGARLAGEVDVGDARTGVG